MGLDFAIDELYSTGWAGLDSSGCGFDTDGRAYPTLASVTAQFERAGFALSVRRVDLFNCFRAEWTDASTGESVGSVVGQTGEEAAVYALAQLRRSPVAGSAS